ncbi:L-ribulose-5-phosphate 4-epimerase AraD [Campylobacter coli]|uniref:L-ribulose-5-phosphate 4-epimerase AraD n=1 Tax=Campylobacter coli TaxID=195 RepID=UPI001D60EF82|nr:L-ribulose-5-phosphate 4-epimerase AraD [Campylobacter coli]EHC5632024.1 L-ribulose-5-phosphate 4-epimerase AraD [Campylobacter coli]EHR2889935.1 L-ribulose-5-phosphate 4-epimerase AraD [Campylobacter coli]EIC9914396.1 L-ribulose-5-phosphate 4-epimerase AraD [Campylobacter coli]EID5127114.1 L-ribulose-5-phosphate 4-epimerase AraD [Campylobacter coli]EID5172759.1 L-ribulose-5-phosphate 4-epimerase AraD [Campylobacter coli]
MLSSLREQVLKANISLVKENLVVLTWGNVSAINNQGIVAIKPSGVEYSKMSSNDIVLLDLDGRVLEGQLKPSSDTPTHLVLYKQYPEIKCIIHTHSPYATAFAQAGKSIQALGTTHADYFFGDIPITRALTKEEVEVDYEANTGKVILETIAGKNALDVPGILVKQHGVFVWGDTIKKALENSVVIEQIAYMNYLTLNLNPHIETIPKFILNKHFSRKHGKSAYYGQNN